MTRSTLLLASLLSLLVAASACDVGPDGAKPASADGGPAYANGGWVDADPMFLTHVCAPTTIKANEAYSLRVKFQAPCWGVELNSACAATLDGNTVKLTVSYEEPSWTSDGGYCEKEITCTLPALPKGDYLLRAGYCATSPYSLEVGDQTSGLASCESIC